MRSHMESPRRVASGAVLVILACAVCRGEYVPPPTIEELVKADFIAIGRFVKTPEGKARFIAKEVLRGDVSVATRAIRSGKVRVKTGDGGVLPFQSLALVGAQLSMGGGVSVDARKERLWFFFAKSWRGGDCQPMGLVAGYRRLLAGKAPPLTFRLLQTLDADMRRQAMEELVADRDKNIIEELHAIAANTGSELCRSAVGVLGKTKLLDSDRFWGKWLRHPAAYSLKEALRRRDSDRFLRELKQAIQDEENPLRLSGLLWDIQKYPRSVYVDIMLEHLDHPSAEVRRRVVGAMWSAFWRLGAERKTSRAAQKDFESLSARVVPMLERRLQIEKDKATRNRITSILARKDELPIVEKLPPWSEAEELKFLLSRLTAHGEHGFIMASAGREVVQYHFNEGLAEMQKKLGQTKIYNTDMVMDGIGYLRDPRTMTFLVSYGETIDLGHRNFHAYIAALARQNAKGSYDALMRVRKAKMASLGDGYRAAWFFDALGELRDPRALAELKALKSHANYHGRLAYVRALAKHDDAWAIKELLQGLRDVDKCEVLRKGWHNRSDIAGALTFVDSDEATGALKSYVEETWPEASRDHFSSGQYHAVHMQNYAGSSRRSAPIGEVARRDPRWLAELAIRKMESGNLAARQAGAEVFRQLTGRICGFKPEAFAGERRGPLAEVRAWWKEHRGESREAWLLSYFAEKGFRMKHLHRRESIPVLCEALSADALTQNLAVEQISVITQKFFESFPIQMSYRGSEKRSIRVKGWLRARGYIEP